MVRTEGRKEERKGREGDFQSVLTFPADAVTHKQQGVRLKLSGLVKDILTGHQTTGHIGCVSCDLSSK